MGARLNGNDVNTGMVTQAEVAARFGISRGRAFQIEQRALQKLCFGILKDPELRAMAEEVCGSENVDRVVRRMRTYKRGVL